MRKKEANTRRSSEYVKPMLATLGDIADLTAGLFQSGDDGQHAGHPNETNN